MPLKVELKAGERIIVGTAVIRNGDQRARFFVEGDAPILREKDILTPATADTPAKKIYLAVQLMYLNGDLSAPSDAYLGLVRDFIEAAPSALPIVEAINNWILSGDVYKALKEARALIAYEAELMGRALGDGRETVSDVWGANAYARTAQVAVGGRELEALLLMKAATRLQGGSDAWDGRGPALDDALSYNRKLWTVLVASATGTDNGLPVPVKQNIANLGLFVFRQTVSAIAEPAPAKLGVLVTINREIAAGLRASSAAAA